MQVCSARSVSGDIEGEHMIGSLPKTDATISYIERMSDAHRSPLSPSPSPPRSDWGLASLGMVIPNSSRILRRNRGSPHLLLVSSSHNSTSITIFTSAETMSHVLCLRCGRLGPFPLLLLRHHHHDMGGCVLSHSFVLREPVPRLQLADTMN